MLMPESGLAIAPAGNLDGDPGIRPQGHMFVGSKAGWYTITDSLPQHAAMPPDFGGGMGVARPTVEQREGVADGSCLCGEVAYEVRKPVRMYHCHCSRCRRARSAAHTTNMFSSIADFAFTRGEELVTEYKVPEALRFGVAFCTSCGGKVPRVRTRARNGRLARRRTRYGPRYAAAGEHLRGLESAVVRYHGRAAAVRGDAAELKAGAVFWGARRLRYGRPNT